MLRTLLAGALAVMLVASAALPGSTAQDKKQPPKKKERIAIADPKDAAKDPDFAIQGEYEGTEPGSGASDRGAGDRQGRRGVHRENPEGWAARRGMGRQGRDCRRRRETRTARSLSR